MRIATWNVNSVRARLDRLLAWLDERQPDVVCLQELKVQDAQFPYDEITDAGYDAVVFGQKTYNGVAILSRLGPPDAAVRGMGTGDADPQARLVTATIDGVRVLCAYFPNGRSVGSEAFEYKLEWMSRLRSHLEETHDPGTPLVLAGDFNVAPDDTDVADPERWAPSVLCDSEARRALEEVRAWGFTDVFRTHNPEGGLYSWWDYRGLAFPRNDGLRIDHIFATAPLAERSTASWIDREQRKKLGREDAPSDHVPVIADFELADPLR